MGKTLRILIVEDMEDDALLLVRELRKGGIDPVFKRVDAEEDMTEALKTEAWDIIISDYSMPRFNGLDALRLAKKYDPDIPFIISSGTIGEDIAVSVMKEGAHDYLMKNNLKRLVPAIERELHDAQERRARKKAEKGLSESEERYRAIFQGSTGGILIAENESRKFIHANPAISKILGYSEEEILSLTVDDIHPKENLENIINDFKAQVRGEKTLSPSVPCLRKDGNIIYVDICTAQIQIDGVGCNVGFLTDITDRKKLEEQLRQAQKMEAIGTLAGGIAHDFNNILSSIIGYSELALMETPEDSKVSQHVQEVLTAGERATDLVKQILTFARQSDAEVKPIQIKYILKEALKLLNASMPSSIEIRETIESDATILADPTQIHQVIMNLCTNAAHSMEDDAGVLTVQLKEVSLDSNFTKLHPRILPGSYLQLRVEDTGCGMSLGSMEKIFDPYFTTKEKEKGTGLGLSVIKGIVDEYKGAITVDSEMGKGSFFTVYIPTIAPQSKTRSSKPTGEEAPTGDEAILVIDDEGPIIRLYEQMLTSLGYRATMRTSPIEALELLKSDPRRFDLVITDMTMPQMTGDLLAIEMKKVRPDIPLILCTGYSKRLTDERAKTIGINAFLMKPVAKLELAKTIRKVLDEKRG